MGKDPPHLQLTGARTPPPPHLQLTGVHRRRRQRLAAGAGALLAIGVALALLLPGTSGPGPRRVDVRISAREYGPVHRAGFVGLSIEYPALAAYLGAGRARIDPVFVSLVRALAPGGSPVLRIGGDSTDHTWWPVAGITPRPGVSYALTPAWLTATRSLAEQAHAKLILGIDLAAGSLRLAAAEAGALVNGIGRRHVAALEIGNEPDIYGLAPWYRVGDRVGYARKAGTWTERAFYQQFSAVRAVLPAGVPAAGPSYAEADWVKQLPAFLAAEPGLGLVTYHRYPLRGCLGHTDQAPLPTLPNLLAGAASAGLAAQVRPYTAIARRAGIPFRVDEINSAACRGKLGVSNTFASALWSLDTLFNMAAVGVAGVNVHTLAGAPYAPFSFARRDGRWTAAVRPVYYGMLMFARAFPAGARLLRLAAPRGPVKAWATRAPNGRIRVVLINQDARRAAVAHLTLPADPAAGLSVERLTGPALSATSGVSLGGRTFGRSTSSGSLAAPKPARVDPAGRAVTVRIAPASAALLTG